MFTFIKYEKYHININQNGNLKNNKAKMHAQILYEIIIRSLYIDYPMVNFMFWFKIKMYLNSWKKWLWIRRDNLSLEIWLRQQNIPNVLRIKQNRNLNLLTDLCGRRRFRKNINCTHPAKLVDVVKEPEIEDEELVIITEHYCKTSTWR